MARGPIGRSGSRRVGPRGAFARLGLDPFSLTPSRRYTRLSTQPRGRHAAPVGVCLRSVGGESGPQGILIVVGVAERLRRQVVALEIEGSNPSVHPILSSLR
jgi:hypothetical protein